MLSSAYPAVARRPRVIRRRVFFKIQLHANTRDHEYSGFVVQTITIYYYYGFERRGRRRVRLYANHHDVLLVSLRRRSSWHERAYCRLNHSGARGSYPYAASTDRGERDAASTPTRIVDWFAASRALTINPMKYGFYFMTYEVKDYKIAYIFIYLFFD